jgi:NAD(P)-dependent dehydrogenase (short-subunit alcohol dehydrogenase family)
MERYDAKRAVIIGGTSGMGLATAKMLLDGGARVLVTGRSQAGLESAQQELGKGALVVSSDARSLTDIDVLASRVKAEFDTFDLLFVNAGLGLFAPLENTTEAMYDEMLNLNAKGPFFAVQKLAPLINRGGAVVLTTSIANVKGMPTLAAYGAARLRCGPSLGCSPLSFFLGGFASTRCRPVPSTRRSSAKRFPIKTWPPRSPGRCAKPIR